MRTQLIGVICGVRLIFWVMFAATLLVLKAVGVSVDQMIWVLSLSRFLGLGAATTPRLVRLHLAHLSPRLVLARRFI